MSYYHPELGREVYTPDTVRIVHFGNNEEYYQYDREEEPDPEFEEVEVAEIATRKKPRNMNSRQERHRRAWWRKR
jgi:hypothetical protein